MLEWALAWGSQDAWGLFLASSSLGEVPSTEVITSYITCSQWKGPGWYNKMELTFPEGGPLFLYQPSRKSTVPSTEAVLLSNCTRASLLQSQHCLCDHQPRGCYPHFSEAM